MYLTRKKNIEVNFFFQCYCVEVLRKKMHFFSNFEAGDVLSNVLKICRIYKHIAYKIKNAYGSQKDLEVVFGHPLSICDHKYKRKSEIVTVIDQFD